MTPFLSFIFGGKTGHTPESLARQRLVFEAMAKRDDIGTPKNVGEGLTALGKAIGYRMAQSDLEDNEAAARAGQNGATSADAASAADAANGVAANGAVSNAGAPPAAAPVPAAPPANASPVASTYPQAPGGGSIPLWDDVKNMFRLGGRY